MNNKLLLVAGLLALVVLAGLTGCSQGTTAQAQTTTPGQPVNINLTGQQGIWVSGEGKVTVVPDIATLSLGVSAQAATVAAAQSQAAAAMDKIITALTGNGIAKNDIKTQRFDIQQMTRYDNATQKTVVTGYQVNNIVTAKIRAIDKVGPIIDAAAAAGGDLTRVNGLSFSVDQPDKVYPQARELAIKDAKAKADQLAKLAGVTLGRPVYISESSASPPVPYYLPVAKDMAGGVSAPTTPISPGDTDITITVQVSYAIQ
jgi:uncharacterized protein